MNKKKLFFLAFLAISSTSVSLFGMEDEPSSNEQTKKENDNQQPDTQEEKNSENTHFEDIIYYLLYKESILHNELIKMAYNQKKEVSNETKRNQKNLRRQSEQQLDTNYNNGKPLWAKINHSPKTELEYDSQVLNNDNQNSNNYLPEYSTVKIYQQQEQFEKGIYFLKNIILPAYDFYEQKQQENQNPNENQKQPLLIKDYSDSSQNTLYDRDYLMRKNKINNHESKSNSKKLFGYEIFNSQQQENKNQSENFEQNSSQEIGNDSTEYNRLKKKTSNNNAYDYLSNMPKHRKDFLTKEAIEEGFKQGTAALVIKRIVAQKPIGDALIEGVLTGFQRGIEEVVATTVIAFAQAGIVKGVEWLNQPNTEAMQLKKILESLEKDIQAKQKLLIGNSAIINTVGQNVEQAQRIFNEQLNKKIEEFKDQVNNNDQLKEAIHRQAEQQKREELTTFSKALARKHSQKINEFKQQQGIHNSSLSAEQSQKLNEFIKELEKNMAEEAQQKLNKLEAKYAPENQEAQFIKEAVAEILQTSPETKFAQLYEKYLDSALNMFETQEKMMDGTFVNNIHTMFNKKAARAA